MRLLAELLGATNATVPADQTTTYVLMAGSGVFIIYVMMRMTKNKKKADPFDTPFQARGLAQQRSIERDMENLLVQLSEMSRQMTAQLDTRAAKLEQLIEDADERIARLKAANREAPARPAFEMPRDAVRDAPVAVSPARPADDVVSDTDDMAPAPTIEPQHAEIYRLADEGKTARLIATELGRPSGEIELILALRPRA